MTKRLIYATGHPYGAPLAMVRGGGTRDPDVKAALRAAGFRWDGTLHAWHTYLWDDDFAAVLRDLADRFDVEVVPKDGQEPLANLLD